MIKQEIIEKISKYFKLTNFEAEKIYDDIFLEIINGVKKDNIADITNLGEFIIKYNNGDSDHKKTVEFLPTLSLEDEINQRSFEEQRSFDPAPFVSYASTEKEDPVENVPELKKETEEITAEAAGDMNTSAVDTEMTGDKSSVEDEIKKKREEILNKITMPREEIKDKIVDSKEEIAEKDIPAVLPAAPEITKTSYEEPVTEIFEANDNNDNIEETFENTPEEIKSEIKEAEDIRERSFSDLFTEVSAEEKALGDSANKTTTPPVENVIPPTAVELHNEITGDNAKNEDFPGSLNALPYANAYTNGSNGGNVNDSDNGNSFEHKLQDDSYYIWYKDSEPNTTDTQTMSYEYELLYQATKEAEYKSKLRVYVTTFIMFFSIVLILLIFSPIIYKYFFSPAENQNTEDVQEETSSGSTEQDISSTENQALVNTLPENNTPPVTNSEQDNNTQSQPPVTQEQSVQEQPKQETPVQQSTESATTPETQTQSNVTAPPGVTLNSVGWFDNNSKVIYVQLENGKFTIQESSWDSDAKANKRLNTVASILPGLTGSIVKADLGSKGIWYRARFGEFASLEEAKAKAEELRNKEKTRLHALLLSFLLYA